MVSIRHLTFFPLFSAARITKRQTSDPVITDIQSAAEFYGVQSAIANHGCHCQILKGLGSYGTPFDARDSLCRSWKSARTCVFLQGGACNGVEDSSYDASNGCGALYGCQKALCEIDSEFQSSISAEQTSLEGNASCERGGAGTSKDSCCGDSPFTYRQFDSEQYSCDSGSLSLTECRVKLVRQTSTAQFHPASDNLAGTAVYGQEGDDTFSIPFDKMNADTFIFATKDHQYFQAMTREEIGGDFNGQWYSNTKRNFYSLQPGFTQWEYGSANMYNRNPNGGEDPWISLKDHHTANWQNQMMYGENGYNGDRHWSLKNAHGGLQVFILTRGNFQDCIVDGRVGEFRNGVYELREE